MRNSSRGLHMMLVAIVAPAIAGAQPGVSAHQRTSSTPPPDSRMALLTKAREDVWRAWFGNDSARLAKLLPAAVAAGSADGWQNRQQTIDASHRSAATGLRLVDVRFDSTNVMVHGDVSVVQGRYRLTVERAGQKQEVAGFATEVFVWQGGNWVNPFWYLDR